MIMSADRLQETPNSRDIAGFGDNVIKLTDNITGETVCFIGKIQGEEKIHFSRAISLKQLESVVELLQKKKMQKFLDGEKYEKAQSFADRKFG